MVQDVAKTAEEELVDGGGGGGGCQVRARAIEIEHGVVLDDCLDDNVMKGQAK